MRSVRWGWLLTGPHVIAAVVFIYVPFLAVVYFSFNDFDGLTRPSWVGLENYRWLAANEPFRQTLGNTARMGVPIVTLSVVASVSISAAVHRAKRFSGFYRSLFLIPMVVTPIASATVWRWMYRPDDGLINRMLQPFGVERITWLSQPNTAALAVALVEVWMLSSFFILVILANLDNVPADVYEAASLDGAGPIAQFWYVTLPEMRPLVWFVIIQSTLTTIKLYDVSVGLAIGGGPAGSTRTLTMLMENESFTSLRMGRGSAIGVAMFGLSLVVTLVQLGLANRTDSDRARPTRRRQGWVSLGSAR